MSQNQGQTQKRCWNCRRKQIRPPLRLPWLLYELAHLTDQLGSELAEQKIACDKTLPHCRNCLKKGRQCLGYGLKLSWPRKGDQRRSASLRKEHYIIPIRTSEASFINATSEDVKASQEQSMRELDGVEGNV